MSFRLTGRGRRSLSGRQQPAVRFRQTRYQERLAQNKMASRRPYRPPKLVGPLTPMGWGLAAGAAVILALSAWFFVLSPKFLVSHVQLSQPTTLSSEELNEVFYSLQDARILGLIPANHIVFLTPKRLSRALSSLYPYVAEAAYVEKDWPNAVAFAVIERKPVFLLSYGGGHRYLLDREGLVLGEVGEHLPSDLIRLEAQLAETPRVGERLVSVPLLDFVLSVQNSWPLSWEFRASRYVIVTDQAGSGGVGGEFAIYTSEGWLIKADSDSSAAQLLSAIDLIIDGEIKTADQRQQLAYIDLRLSDRAFYCLEDQPCANDQSH